jgi:hypothetical protein
MAQTSPTHRVVVHIDRNQYEVTVDEMSEADLRRLPSPEIGDEYDLWIEQPGQEDHRLEQGEVVALRNGMHFTSVQRATNPG